jgi:protein-S-isoprenylcysteine O-methyltransferase Ste14
MKQKITAYSFVVVQFACLIYIFVSGGFLAESINGLLVEVAGLILGISAILQMKLGNFNVAPLPKSGGELVTSGVYSLIRHPMYLAQLLVVAALTVDYYSHARLFAVLLLFTVLVFKLHFEEKQLKVQFDGYEEYMQKTWRLIPYIY